MNLNVTRTMQRRRRWQRKYCRLCREDRIEHGCVRIRLPEPGWCESLLSLRVQISTLIKSKTTTTFIHYSEFYFPSVPGA